jgi:hypothetical protein
VTEVADRPAAEPAQGARRLGGIEVNELLTSSAAALLVILLISEGITILDMRGLLGPHMFIGLVLIGPVALKLASTGYRFVRYYTGAPVYVAKGPPHIALRALAPLLVATTVMIFATGVWLLLLGHRSDQVLMLHKVAFIVWSGVFGVHFLAYVPRAAGSLRDAWAAKPSHRLRTPGRGITALLVVTSLCAGLALALVLLPHIGAWHRDYGF